MAFSWSGDLSGAKPVVKRFPVAATCYQGQLLIWDGNAGGIVEPAIAAAAASPDATSMIAGICSAVVTSPTFSSTYKGDTATYDTSQADQVANEPVGPCLVDVTLITPTTLVKAPIYQTTAGTAPDELAVTTAQTDGLTVVTAGFSTTISNGSTLYCRTGVNHGLYRKVTTAGTTTQTVLLAFPYNSAVGDKYVCVNVKEGFSAVNLDSYMMGLNAEALTTTYGYYVYVHELNLEEAGKEYAVLSFSTRHLL